jgi:ribonuclease E
MPNKMLIDATHPEETRVVVLRGNRVEEFDFESAQRKQLRGNIYLAKVTRVEPSLQAAFVDYGGNRHGFLAFSEIHPDYYQIPVADRQALIEDEERAQRAADDEADRRSRRGGRHHPARRSRRGDEVVRGEVTETPAGDSVPPEQFAATPAETDEAAGDGAEVETFGGETTHGTVSAQASAEPAHHAEHDETSHDAQAAAPQQGEMGEAHEAEDESEHHESEHEDEHQGEDEDDSAHATAGEIDRPMDETAPDGEATALVPAENGEASPAEARDHEDGEEEEIVESVGGSDALEEVPDRFPRYRRQYKIQEVIKRRQVMLVQVVKEERGTKGAALTTYLSLAGRYSVLMPNTARGGGISRKITNSEDRARLKEAAADLEVPEGMGVILRTAGASRTKIEIKRDFEYLLRMWETVRDLTLKSTAPKLVYEEGSLVKRSIRDLYSKDIDEVIVAGSEAFQEAKDFMRMLMPSHARNVKPYHDTQPLLSRYGVENQLDAMFSPVVQLRSGGYIVLNQAEALVAIDVNSGRATREHHIEDTALKTNLEASEEVARQLRLRDLAGLIVIDYIDMDEKRNNRAVERRLKECLKHDRARIQVGRISHFGLLEMSRQRIRTSVLESSTEKCPYCGGTGHVRSVSSLALQVVRALEEQLIKGGTHNLIVRTRPDVALYVLNQKRAHLRGLEERFAITITISADESVAAPQAFIVDRGEQVHSVEAAKALAERSQTIAAPLEEDDDLEDLAATEDESEGEETETVAPALAPENGEDGPPRRRRRRRRGGRDSGDHARGQERSEEHGHEHIPITESAGQFAPHSDDQASDHEAAGDETATEEGSAERQSGEFSPRDRDNAGEPRHDGERRRRRGRRGGRRNRHRNGDTAPGREHGEEQHASQEYSGQEAGQDTDQQHAGNESAYEQHGSPGEHDTFAPAQELSAPSSAEPELKAAVADLDAAPPPAAPPEPEAPRRRSTVRERAPIFSGEDTPAPAPQPSVAPAPVPDVTESNEAPASDQPRKTGWWSRRFAGG